LALAQLREQHYFVLMPNLAPISATEAASQTGVPKRTILWAIRAGKLKANKLGDGATSAYLIQQSDLDQYMEQRARESA
jgi:excisionase family DNA binding protein